MKKMHVKRGDTVKVIAGKDKGKEGKIITAIPADGKVIVEGVAVAKRHQKARVQGQESGIFERRKILTMSRMQDKYNKEVAPALMEKFSYKSTMQIPKLDKIVINIGMGEAKDNPKAIEAACGDLAAITGQKPIITKAKKSVANFKLREGMNIGCKVTLRADKMYEFLDRFFNVALPRVRDFRGINPNGFDGRGNYSVGIKEQLIFPEIDYDKIDKIRGMDINIVTTAQTDEEARELLKLMGAPFRS